MVSGKDALLIMLNGGMVEFGERYYRYNTIRNAVEWSDNKKVWKKSTITVNAVLASEWNEVNQ